MEECVARKVFNRFTTLEEIIEWAKNIQNKDKVKDYKLDLRGLIITEIESQSCT